MGYSHYYHVNSYYDKQSWDNLVKDVKKLLEINCKGSEYKMNSTDDSVCTLGDLIERRSTGDSITSSVTGGYYRLDKDEISFNGVGENAHEQFQLYQRMPPDVFERHEELAKAHSRLTGLPQLRTPFFEFTKTAHKPYDLVVCCCLLLAKKHLRDDIVVTSDGSWDEWQDAMKIIVNDFGYKIKEVPEDNWQKDGMFEVI
tara:strand:+ start:916 stop:1515 length:600 start_codon:yes stop_codon:yes gene_type:complete